MSFKAFQQMLGQIAGAFTQTGADPLASAGPVPETVAGPRVPQAPVPAYTYVPFTEPQAGTCSVEVPREWRVTGGFNHPAPGDRRPFVEARSPDGIVVLMGDPECPQAFCHRPDAPEGQFVPYATGCVFMNLPPSGSRLAAHFVANVLSRRIGPVRVLARRECPELIERLYAQARAAGKPIASTIKITAHEIRFEAAGRVGWCLATSLCDVAASFGFMTSWEGGMVCFLAPPDRVAIAEEVVARAFATFTKTPRLYAIYQHDEQVIASNGAIAHQGQLQWFAGQQAAHNAQQSAGDAIVSSYWNTQASYDHASQARSDAMRGRERLYDAPSGRDYDAPSGSNYYWLDARSGEVVGTDTDSPPDAVNGYTPLRRR